MRTQSMKHLLALVVFLMPLAVSGLAAQEGSFRLSSAQVVTATEGPPFLRLLANGPIAYEVVGDDPSASPAPTFRLRLRLYGMKAGEGWTGGGVAPFAVSAAPDARGLVLTVEAPGLPAGTRLAVGRSMRSSELTIIVAQVP